MTARIWTFIFLVAHDLFFQPWFFPPSTSTSFSGCCCAKHRTARSCCSYYSFLLWMKEVNRFRRRKCWRPAAGSTRSQLSWQTVSQQGTNIGHDKYYRTTIVLLLESEEKMIAGQELLEYGPFCAVRAALRGRSAASVPWWRGIG